MSKAFDIVNKNKLILTTLRTSLSSKPPTFKDNKHALNTKAHSQNSNKSKSGVPHVGIRPETLFKIYIFEINFFPKDVQISTYPDDITATVSHTNYHLSPTIYTKIFLQNISLFISDPATLSFKLNNQTPTKIKTPKNSWNYF